MFLQFQAKLQFHNSYISHVNAENDSDDESQQENKHEQLIFKTGLDTPYERNRIVFGAPGTGKSYLLKEDVKEVKKYLPLPWRLGMNASD